MMNIGLMKGNSIRSNTIFFDVYGYAWVNGYFTSSISQTITVTYRDGSINSYTGSGNINIYKADGMSNGTVKVSFQRPDAITSWKILYLSNSFPDISFFTNLTSINLEYFSSISFTNPYLFSVQKRLTGILLQRGPDISNVTVQDFLKGLSNLTYLYFGIIYGAHNRADYAAFLPYLAPKLTRFACRNFYGQLIPDCTALVNLVEADFGEFARIADGGISGDCIDYLPNTNKLKKIVFTNGNATLTNIDILVNKIYAWANANANNGVTLQIGGNNASPTGTYDGTTDWSGGLPTSPKAKLWHLVNTRSWIITYTP